MASRANRNKREHKDLVTRGEPNKERGQVTICTEGPEKKRVACNKHRHQEGLLSPLDGSAAEAINTIRQGVALAGVAVPPSKHNGLNPSIKLR